MKLHWNKLSKIGKLRIINRTYIYLIIVPIVAKIFEKVSSPLSVPFMGPEFQLTLELPFSWKLIYLAALVFTIASILFNGFIPNMIEENNSYGDFLASNKTISHLSDYLDNIGVTESWVESKGLDVDVVNASSTTIVIDKLGININDADNSTDYKRITALYGLVKLRYFLAEENRGSMEFIEKMKVNQFWRTFNVCNRHNVCLRVLISLLYLVGFSIVGYVIIESIMVVLQF